ncbi:MAG: hypothetical protein QGD91_05480 [Actinomycetota bacterium]|nr:hypothetical protein [Actinomycetota bacterium]MDK1038364.1 hypothetical protein [Actinomycetota bacterium]MDK1097560.1 hypothetical protein [Actinomycetota bacterium]MDK1103459.1 hypothetical protein [Actinomycetota bacterium]
MERIDIADMVELAHLKTELNWEGDAGVAEPEHEQGQFWGTKQNSGAAQEALSQIIDKTDERIGGEGLTDEHRIVIDQYEDAFRHREEVVTAALANDNFDDSIKVVFGPIFLDPIIVQMNANEDVFKLVISDDKMRVLFSNCIARRLWDDTHLESDFTSGRS